MAEPQIKFDDGAAYENMMGVWSRKVGSIFLDWLAPAKGLRWVDVGCGNGAFTELVIERCAPKEVKGIDPSAGQLEFARSRPGAGLVEYTQGDAMALPYADNSFDVAAMALVLFFVPDPVKALAEMTRVVRPGGMIAVYMWDVLGGGFPMAPVQAEARAMGLNVPWPPSVEISQKGPLKALWREAKLEAIDSRTIKVERDFPNFDDYWVASLTPSIRPAVSAMPEKDLEHLQGAVRRRMGAPERGPMTASAHANAIQGRIPS